jgi:type IX secretion system PorP/SprF family membrane protein
MKLFANPIIPAIAIVALSFSTASAQLSGFQSAYFQNQYLTNPAMAGIDKGLNLNLGYQQQWTSANGGPKLQNLTADYNSGNRVGLGINISNDQAGLIRRTRIMGTYAYHLPLNNKNEKLNFGLSVGFNDSYIDFSQIIADPGDVAAQSYNQRSTYFDGDLGISYTSDKFNIQASIPNLKSVFFGSDAESLSVDRSTFYTAISYKIALTKNENDLSLEPKLAFRGIKGFDNLFDIGANFVVPTYHANLTALYHTNQSLTFAAGLEIDKIGLLLAYTNNTGPMSSYANHTFELGLAYKLWNK